MQALVKKVKEDDVNFVLENKNSLINEIKANYKELANLCVDYDCVEMLYLFFVLGCDVSHVNTKLSWKQQKRVKRIDALYRELREPIRITSLAECQRQMKFGILGPEDIELCYHQYKEEFKRYGVEENYTPRQIHYTDNAFTSPSSKSLKFVCFSDLHGSIPLVPHGDVAVFCGDSCNSGDLLEYERFIAWFEALPHAHKIIVPGNHDYPLLHADARENLKKKGIHFLNGAGIKIDGINIYGVSAIPHRSHVSANAFAVDRAEMKNIVDRIPTSTHVLLTHFPAWGIGDANIRVARSPCGDSGNLALTYRLSRLPRLFYHIFGHVHMGKGHYYDNVSTTRYVNTAETVTEIYVEPPSTNFNTPLYF